MEKSIDFDRVAGWYDAYVQTDFDRDFWVEQARRRGGRRVELMCGTGRISLPILRAGLTLTCVDYSEGLLAVLRDKLAREHLAAEVVQRDVRALGLSGFDYAFIGFHSFAELASLDDARAGLRSIRNALNPGGSLALSLHNPVVRAPALDGTPRAMGPFALPDGNRLEVAGRYILDPATRVVTGSQRYCVVDGAGRVVREDELPVRFRLTAPAELETLAHEAGFEVRERWGDYDWSPYDPASSPYFLCELGAAGEPAPR